MFWMQYTGVTYFQKHEVGSGIYSNSNAIEETLKSVYKRLFVFFTYQEVGNSSDFIVLAVTVIHVGQPQSLVRYFLSRILIALCRFGAFLLYLEKKFKGGQKSSLAKKSSFFAP